MKTPLFLLAFLPLLATGQPTERMYFDPFTRQTIIDTVTNPVCLERGHVWKITQLKATKDCEPYIVDNLYYSIKVYPACDLTRSDCMRCGVRQKSTAKDWVDTIWRDPKIKRTVKIDSLKFISCKSIPPKFSTSYTTNVSTTRDTIPVIMLACDTMDIDLQNVTLRLNSKTDIKFSQVVFWLCGYEVTRFDSLRCKWHVAYLDSNKRPVKYLVWMSKEMK